MIDYPAMIRLKGKKATVIGGGAIAERKIGPLLEAEASVFVVSPTVTNQIHQWVNQGLLEWVRKDFESSDVLGSFLIIAATDQRKVNQKVFESVNDHQLINIVDDPENSNFLVPAAFKQGKLTIAISTSGSSPVLARRIKKDLMKQYDESFASYLDFLQSCRTTVKEEIEDPKLRREIFLHLLDDEFLELTRLGKFDERHQRFHEYLTEKRSNSHDER